MAKMGIELSVNTKKNTFQEIMIFAIAFIFTIIIFLVDINIPLSISIGALYSLVILYSWLLPGQLSSIYVAVICTVLIITGVFFSEVKSSEDHFVGINRIISVIVIWICSSLVSIAKKSFKGMEEYNDGLKKQINMVEIKSKELDEKVYELKTERSKLKKTEERLTHFNNQLEQKNKELEQFVYIASHDLQEPLRTIMNYTDLLSEEYNDKFDEVGAKSLYYVTRAAIRMSGQIRGLLEYSKIGRMEDIQKIDCNYIVEEVLKDLEASVKDSSAQIKVVNLPTIKASPLDIRLLFQNLIGNALKFRKKDQFSKVEISAEDDGDFWKFRVKDNGIGIKEQYLEKIFIIFQGIQTSDYYTGTGIGLSHCKKIVEIYGGTIWVESEEGKGSSFYFTLPKG